MTTPTLANSAITALATYRLTKLILEDEITAPIRDRVLSKFPPESTKIGYLLTCPWCVSMYMAPLAYFAPTPIKESLAASAVTGILAERI